MKLTYPKFVSALFVFTMIFSLCPLTVSTEMLTDRESRADRVKELYNQSIISSESSPKSDAGYTERNYTANVAYSAILEHIKSHDDELRAHFSGAYVNDEGYLVVSLCCDSDFCQNYIAEKMMCSDVLFRAGVGSFYETDQQLNAINEQIGSLQKKIVGGEKVDAESVSLMKLHPRTSYNAESNTISVIFTMDENTENAVIKSKSNRTDDASALSALSESEISALKEFNAVVNSFKKTFSVQGDISYTVCSEVEIAEDEDTEAWRPGRGLFVYEPSTRTFSGISTGYRAKYSYNGGTYYGFVTCAHATNVGSSVYIMPNSASANKLGVILNRSYGGKIDVSFLRMTNSNYTNSNTIYYTSSQAGVTRPGTILDGGQTTAALNARIQKSGEASYLTYGYVAETSVSYYVNDVYFYDLFKADRHMSESGDSGAVTYIDGSGVSGKAVGIVKGSSGGVTAFVKADNIKSVFGAEAY